jgi:hypothetical protein
MITEKQNCDFIIGTHVVHLPQDIKTHVFLFHVQGYSISNSHRQTNSLS